jgi:hypothetical protein
LSFDYSVFGLSLHSNVPIPGLNYTGGPLVVPDVEIHLGLSPSIHREFPAEPGEPTFASSDLDAAGHPTFQIWRMAESAYLYLLYCDGLEFWLDRKGTEVWARWPAESSVEIAATFLLGPVLGMLLRLRGVTCLHASAVAFDNHAVAFTGEEGAGKSTTAAAFARRGHPVLSDDIVAIVEREGAFHVMPAYPYLSLWPDSVKMLYGPEKRLPAFSRDWDKRVLSLAEDRLGFQEKSLPLGAIFILAERGSDTALEMPTPRESLVALIANSYATGIQDTEMRAQEFALLGRILASVPVRRVRPHQDPSKIDRMCEVIQSGYSALKTQPLSASSAAPESPEMEPPDQKIGTFPHRN